MNTVVNKLLDVDKEARQLLDDAQQYYDRTLQEIEQEKVKLHDAYAEKGETHIRELQAEQAGEVDEVVGEVRRRTGELRQAMEARYNEYHRQWEDALFNRTIGAESTIAAD